LAAFDHITFDPLNMGGRPCIRGMRVTVGMIVGMIAADHSIEEVLHLYPYLEREDVVAGSAICGVAERGKRSNSSDHLKLLFDMNLSPVWATILQAAGFETVHWSQVGKPTACDKEIFDWAADLGYVVITHDLDFGTILAHSFARGPSVIQIRANDLSPQLLQLTTSSSVTNERLNLRILT
jgi:predicted nuclease of predicted toxin-antitoxin system/uncharacterized protein (DUF433 family)